MIELYSIMPPTTAPFRSDARGLAASLSLESNVPKINDAKKSGPHNSSKLAMARGKGAKAAR
jgi:hypothetical protein